MDDGTSITVTGYPTSGTGSVYIPSSINGKPVTGIGYAAFYDCVSITHLTIPNSVTDLADFAFGNCKRLTNVTIPDSVTFLRSSVFQGCSRLCFVTLPAYLTSIGEYAFYGCNLSSVTIPGQVGDIGTYAFNNCSRLETANFMGRAPFLGTGVFDNASGNFSIRYNKAHSNGWTKPTWQGYACSENSKYNWLVWNPSDRLVNANRMSRIERSFDTVAVGYSMKKIFTIENHGSRDLVINGVSSSGTGGNFKVTQPGKSRLMPGQSTTFKVTFKPKSGGVHNTTIAISSDDYTLPFYNYSFNLVGSGS